MSGLFHRRKTWGGAAWTCKNCGHTYNPLEAHYSKRDRCPVCNSTDIDKTRSSLLAEWLRFLREKKPRFAIYENVKNITSSKFKYTFDLFLKELESYGYNVYWKVLNSKDYGIPQNRERVYCVIIRADLDNGEFKFPEKIPLCKTLQDMLEDHVDEKYYLSDVSLKYALLGYNRKMLDSSIENIVFLELKRRGYEVFVGKNETKEIDFVAVRREEKIYVQVCVQIPQNSDREVGNLMVINDHYPKYVVTLNEMDTGIENGIKIVHLVDFLLAEQW